MFDEFNVMQYDQIVYNQMRNDHIAAIILIGQFIVIVWKNMYSEIKNILVIALRCSKSNLDFYYSFD